MSIIFISMRPQSVGVNLILPRERTENDRGNESCLRSLRHGPNYFSPSRSRWIVQLEFVHYSNVSCSCDNWLAIFQIAPYDIFIRKCVLARLCSRTKKKRTEGRVINLCRGNFVKRRKVEREIIWKQWRNDGQVFAIRR